MIDAKKAIIIGAHPDDETCWAGGLIASYPDVEWHSMICSLPFREGQDRRAMDYYDAAYCLGIKKIMILPYHEVIRAPLCFTARAAELVQGYDLIVTHSAKGEYGHIHHINVHEWVVKNFPDIPKLFFGYGEGISFDLSEEAYDIKMKALACYRHDCRAHKGVPKWKALLARYPIIKERRECFIQQ